MIEILIGLILAWLIVLTYKVLGYRSAILRLQRDIWETGGVVDALTKGKKLKAGK